ncbi:MAG: aldehyde dehydrogenase [Rhodospirillaceae bacterium]|jgi:thiamine pyrophosphate-dependent acetolactate synthase large subunit-like protein|nr:aldehyde dehydrogenase [Rhodospirillales bacterium]MBT3904238.1 aldehyde dehydrogenase [Rhodospirillaceae bacterium]MBT4701726.1 aldehyde dehydrogenase [Rhodospirillaceae bacterium]MBT5034771.1 aldehyde dehydrogenase [Rhodospirillaceae bacterium]MBT6218348.1 aldehyde dehydrogenase [Rhodospirillaceae bacterium]
MTDTHQTDPHQINRRALTKDILGDREDILAISGLGGAGYDLTASRGDHDFNFCLHGSMGGAPLVAMGLALAQPERRVVAVLGDGDMLMGIGSLATIMTERPTNLAVLVLDNGHYVETGGQKTAAGHGADLTAMAAAAGFETAITLTDPNKQADVVKIIQEAPGPVFVCAKISKDQPESLPKTRDGNLMKLRFRKALLGTE